MGFLDVFKDGQYKNKYEELQKQYEDLQSLLTPETQAVINSQKAIQELNGYIQEKNKLLNQLNEQIETAAISFEKQKSEMETKSKQLSDIIAQKNSEIIKLDEEILVQEFGLYKPTYDFANALDYKEELAKIRAKQKEMIKGKTAVTGAIDWTVNGSSSKGKKMVADTQKLLLRAFNTECDELISKVKYTNFDSSLNRIYKSSETISKLGVIMRISITPKYLDLKVKELRLAFEYQMKKHEEKEAQKAARAEMREAAKLQREIEAQRKKIEKEQTH